jgi:hypothetical protein
VNPDPDTDSIRIQGFDDQKLKKKIQWNFFSFFDQKLQITGTYAQATGEAFQHAKENIVHFKK